MLRHFDDMLFLNTILIAKQGNKINEDIMNKLKLVLLTSFIAALSACGDNGDNNTASTAADSTTAAMEAEAKAKADEAVKRAEELEALENQ